MTPSPRATQSRPQGGGSQLRVLINIRGDDALLQRVREALRRLGERAGASQPPPAAARATHRSAASSQGRSAGTQPLGSVIMTVTDARDADVVVASQASDQVMSNARDLLLPVVAPEWVLRSKSKRRVLDVAPFLVVDYTPMRSDALRLASAQEATAPVAVELPTAALEAAAAIAAEPAKEARVVEAPPAKRKTRQSAKAKKEASTKPLPESMAAVEIKATGRDADVSDMAAEAIPYLDGLSDDSSGDDAAALDVDSVLAAGGSLAQKHGTGATSLPPPAAAKPLPKRGRGRQATVQKTDSAVEPASAVGGKPPAAAPPVARGNKPVAKKSPATVALSAGGRSKRRRPQTPKETSSSSDGDASSGDEPSSSDGDSSSGGESSAASTASSGAPGAPEDSSDGDERPPAAVAAAAGLSAVKPRRPASSAAAGTVETPVATGRRSGRAGGSRGAGRRPPRLSAEEIETRFSALTAREAEEEARAWGRSARHSGGCAAPLTAAPGTGPSAASVRGSGGVAPQQTVVVTSTAVGAEDRHMLREVVASLRGQWTDDVFGRSATKPTHLVAAAGQVLTSKILWALARGVPIVRPEWLLASLDRGAFLPLLGDEAGASSPVGGPGAAAAADGGPVVDPAPFFHECFDRQAFVGRVRRIPRRDARMAAVFPDRGPVVLDGLHIYVLDGGGTGGGGGVVEEGAAGDRHPTEGLAARLLEPKALAELAVLLGASVERRPGANTSVVVVARPGPMATAATAPDDAPAETAAAGDKRGGKRGSTRPAAAAAAVSALEAALRPLPVSDRQHVAEIRAHAAVSAAWVVECVAQCRRVSIGPFLLRAPPLAAGKGPGAWGPLMEAPDSSDSDATRSGGSESDGATADSEGTSGAPSRGRSVTTAGSASATPVLPVAGGGPAAKRGRGPEAPSTGRKGRRGELAGTPLAIRDSRAAAPGTPLRAGRGRDDIPACGETPPLPPPPSARQSQPTAALATSAPSSVGAKPAAAHHDGTPPVTSQKKKRAKRGASASASAAAPLAPSPLAPSPAAAGAGLLLDSSDDADDDEHLLLQPIPGRRGGGRPAAAAPRADPSLLGASIPASASALVDAAGGSAKKPPPGAAAAMKQPQHQWSTQQLRGPSASPGRESSDSDDAPYF